jgi:hypothetical protein
MFFQPVRQGDGRFVDGGVLSNLPSFVFSPTTEGVTNTTEPILAFQLESSYAHPSDWKLPELGARLLTAVVDGATDVQARLQPHMHVVKIPTAEIKATDFELMDEQKVQHLIECGAASVERFVRDEISQLRSPRSQSLLFKDTEEMDAFVAERDVSQCSEVVISDDTSRFAWKLFPTLLNWRLRGRPIRVLLPANTESGTKREQEEYRRRLLVGLGVEVISPCELPFRGWILSGPSSHALVRVDSSIEGAPACVGYSGWLHDEAIRALRQRLTDPTVAEGFVPTVEQFPIDEVLRLLKQGVGQYARDGINISLEYVVPSKVYLLTRKVRASKYAQVPKLLDLFRATNTEPFAPLCVRWRSGHRSAMTPPVLEEHSGTLVAIEGNTRMAYAFSNAFERVYCLVVRGRLDDLPGKPIPIHQHAVVRQTLTPAERMPNFNFNLFRRIEAACHPPSQSAKSGP